MAMKALGFIAKVEGDGGDGLPRGQPLQGEANMQLLAPAAEGPAIRVL
jgi:hypothetical protein